MSVLACGLNTSGQVLEAGPGILCCPSPVILEADSHITSASVAFSHILWRTDLGWQWTGHDVENFPAKEILKPSWKVFVCGNRFATINDVGSVLLWNNERWRTLHFQKREPDENIQDNIQENTQDNLNINDEVKESTNIFMKSEYENTIKKDIENSSHDKVPDEEIFERQENMMNKRQKVEIITKKEDNWPVSDLSSRPEKRKIRFDKIAVEDNALLALDTDGVVYSGSIPVPLRVKVQDVGVGKEHCMALTTLGNVLTWGSGMRGQLGIGELCQSEKPLPVDSLEGIPITTITCGAWHCVALSESGDLYVWGWNESGQLGFPYKCEGSQSLFNFMEHSCQCPKKTKSVTLNHDSDNVEEENIETDDKREEKREGESKETQDNNVKENKKTENKREGERKEVQDKRINLERRQDIEGQTERENKETQEERKKKKEEENKDSEDKREGERKETQNKRINPARRQEVINVQASPVLLDYWTEDVSVRNVKCGDRHTLYMLDDGSVWAAGMNRYGQLGLGHVISMQEPCRVFKKGIKDIYAGGWNSIFIPINTSTNKHPMS